MLDTNIGIDVGGTHTDLTAVRGQRVVRAKSLTTHDNYSDGIFEALSSAAEQLSLSVTKLLSTHTKAFVNGNTIVTNAITELKGSKVGVLTTAGFGDICRFGRGNRDNLNDDHLQSNLPQIVSKDCIVEVSERIDRDGKVLVNLKEDHLRAQVDQLMDKGIDTIAICFLWSTSNSYHEKMAKRVIQSRQDDIFVTCSIDTAPIFREFERWVTAILNCYVQPPVNGFVTTIAEGLKRRGYKKKVEFFNGLGGILNEEEVKRLPIQLYSSGPAGGAIGAAALARKYNIKNLLCGDMGGTSFDTTLIANKEPIVAQRCKLGAFDTAISLLDIVSVGAGGGSILSLDSRGVPKVGPQSAGSKPGPVCYGKGGTLPTITDCVVTLGILRPDNYLGGKHPLDVKAAASAIETQIGKPMGWNAVQAAAGAYNLVVANMANALRGVSVRRGHDPRKCTFIAYGGALPIFAAGICENLNISNMIVPNHSSAFSAYGLLEADYIRRKSTTIGLPLNESNQMDRVRQVRDKLVENITADLVAAGFRTSDIEFRFGADLRYEGQLSEMYLELARHAIDSSTLTDLRKKFDTAYETEFGPDTAWRTSRLILINYVVTGLAKREKPEIEKQPLIKHQADNACIGKRPVFLPDLGETENTNIYDSEKIECGGTLSGPAIIEVRDTTIYAPKNSTVERDEYANFRVNLSTNIT